MTNIKFLEKVKYLQDRKNSKFPINQFWNKKGL